MANLEFVNKICPKCKNPNYMVSLGNFLKAYKYEYKCMNCGGYFNDDDFKKEPLSCSVEKENSKYYTKRGQTMKKQVTVVMIVESEDEINMSDRFIRQDLEQEIACASNYYEVVSIKTEIINSENSKFCRYYEHNNKKPCCTHECDGCVWYE